MTISEIITDLSSSNIITEQEVRTKVAIPILECLGYPTENRAEEFPIFLMRLAPNFSLKLPEEGRLLYA